eukprot:1510125-Prymnesium_polylepis.1
MHTRSTAGRFHTSRRAVSRNGFDSRNGRSHTMGGQHHVDPMHPVQPARSGESSRRQGHGDGACPSAGLPCLGRSTYAGNTDPLKRGASVTC